jgi:hypothetical protein
MNITVQEMPNKVSKAKLPRINVDKIFTCFCRLLIVPEPICTRNNKVVFLWVEKSRKIQQ